MPHRRNKSARALLSRRDTEGRRLRAPITADRLDRHVTGELHKLDGFDAVTVSVGYRLRAVDESGCNWTGDLVPRYGAGAPGGDVVAAALRPIARAAQARYNLSE